MNERIANYIRIQREEQELLEVKAQDDCTQFIRNIRRVLHNTKKMSDETLDAQKVSRPSTVNGG